MDPTNIIFQTLTSTVDGVGASTGKETETAFNTNFALAKQLLEALFNIAAITVTSESITQLKADTTTTPYTLYYTTDPLDNDNPTWYPVMQVGFSDLQGSPNDNIALKTILDSKGAATDVAQLQSNMQTAQLDISTLKTKVATNTNNIGTNTSSISALRADVANRVRTPEGDTLYLRFVSQTGALEYSPDGTTWTDVTSAGTSFAALSGNAYDNVSLVNYVAAQIQTAINSLTTDFVDTSTFNDHTLNNNNPHGVTKEQLGLGNVENYSAADMPISDAARAEFNTLRDRFPVFYYVSADDYYGTVDIENAIYVISSAFDSGSGPTYQASDFVIRDNQAIKIGTAFHIDLVNDGSTILDLKHEVKLLINDMIFDQDPDAELTLNPGTLSTDVTLISAYSPYVGITDAFGIEVSTYSPGETSEDWNLVGKQTHHFTIEA